MTELEKEIMRVLDLHELGKSIYAKPGDDGISRADFVRSEPQRMGATGMDLQPPIRSPLQQAEPQTLEETKQDLPAVAAGVTTGPLVGTAEAADLALGLVKGAYKSINPGADETRMGAFLSGITEQFESGYGEAARSMLLDMGRKAGYSQDQIDAMDEAITAGSLFGIGGAVKQAPKMISKGLDAVETLGDRATQQLAEGGTRLMAGAPIDDAVNKGFAAAGDAVAKFRAPTEKEPGIIAFHGSGADFDEFKLEKIGTGTKATQYGHGLYFSDYEDVATYFRGISSPEIADYKLNGNSVTDMYNKAQDSQDYEKAEVLEQVLLHDRPDEIAKRFTVEEGYSQETAEFAKSINYDTLKGFDPDGNEVSLGRTYKTELSVDVENMLDWQAPLKNQPEAIKEKVRSLVDEDLRETFDYNVDKGITGGNAYLNYIGKNKKEASGKLAEAGLDGIKYKDIGGTLGYTLENAPTNYVVFKPEAIKILEKYGIVGPVAITGAAASQQEGESDGQSS